MGDIGDKGYSVSYEKIIVRSQGEEYVGEMNVADPFGFEKGEQLKFMEIDKNLKVFKMFPPEIIDYIIFPDRTVDLHHGNHSFMDVEIYFQGYHSIFCFLDVSPYTGIEDYFRKNKDVIFLKVYLENGQECYVNQKRVFFVHMSWYKSRLFRKINPGGYFQRKIFKFEGLDISAEINVAGVNRESDFFREVQPYLIGLDPVVNGFHFKGTILISDRLSLKVF